MPHILSLAWFDCYDLACSVRQRSGQLKEREDGLSIIDIRGPRRGTTEDDEDFLYIGAVVGKGRWPELTSMIKRIERQGVALGGVEFGRVYLEKLYPGAITPWKREEAEYFTRYTRLRMALRTNPFAWFYNGGEHVQMAPGWLNAVNVRTWHSAANFGQNACVYLVLDTRKAEPVMVTEAEEVG